MNINLLLFSLHSLYLRAPFLPRLVTTICQPFLSPHSHLTSIMIQQTLVNLHFRLVKQAFARAIAKQVVPSDPQVTMI